MSNENATSTNHSDKAVIKGNVVPHPDLWVSFTFLTLCKNVFLYWLYVCVCLHAWEISPAQAFFAVGELSEGVGLPCIMWWVDLIQKPSTQSLFPSSSRRGEKAGKARVRKPIV